MLEDKAIIKLYIEDIQTIANCIYSTDATVGRLHNTVGDVAFGIIDAIERYTEYTVCSACLKLEVEVHDLNDEYKRICVHCENIIIDTQIEVQIANYD